MKATKLFALSGSDINSKNIGTITKLNQYDYTILAFDAKAMLFAKSNGLTCLTIDNLLDHDFLYKCLVAAHILGYQWYQTNCDGFTSDGICWPALDRDAMNFFWREILVACALAERIYEQGVEDIHFMPCEHKPSLFYYKADTWKYLIQLYKNELKVISNVDHTYFRKNILDLVKRKVGNVHYLDPIFADSIFEENNEKSVKYKINHPKSMKPVTDKIIFAFNPHELYRFAPIIKNIKTHFNNRVKVFTLENDIEVAKQWEKELGIPVQPGPGADEINYGLAEQFQNAYQHIFQNSKKEFWNIFLKIQYQFEYFCKDRWPKLASKLLGWTNILLEESPEVIITSQLLDAESQLPAVSARQLEIETFSLPHSRFQRLKNMIASNYILYDCLSHKKALVGSGIESERVISCRNIISDYSYPTHNQEYRKKKLNKKLNILVLVSPTSVGASPEHNLIVPYTLASKQISHLQHLINPPNNIRDHINVKLKIHPRDKEPEILELAGVDKNKYLLPKDSDLLKIIDEFDLVLDLNCGSISAVILCITKKMPVLFWWNGFIKYFDFNAEMLLQAGKFLETAEDLWRVLKKIVDNNDYLQRLKEKSIKFYEDFLDNRDYDLLEDIFDKKLSKEAKQPMLSTQTNQNEILNIDADPNFFYGEIPEIDFIKILENGKETKNIEKAILAYCQETDNQYFREYALDPRRALGLNIFGNLKDKRLLDYGCGLGSIGILAAKAGAHVTFVDSCLPRLEVAQLRAKQHHLNQTQFVACKNWRSFPDHLPAFDNIFLNGILEWVPETCRCSFDQVLEYQIDFLKTMQRLLNADGSIYLAIENRFALQYFMGYPEDHTEIPYLSIMSRDEANKLHQSLKGREYLAWTWALDDFKKYLPEADLNLREAYAIFPDYRFPRVIANIEDKVGLKKGMALEKYDCSPEIKKRFIDYIFEMNLIEHFVYSYSLLISR